MRDRVFLNKRYEVLTKIGAGGMADVYKGKDYVLNRYVAIKVLKKEFREDSNFVGKFRSEARSAAGLMHPNIVNVYDVGEDRGLYYMVMELVEGITLKEYIDIKGRLSGSEVINIAIQMCNGIEAAHKSHIIHRDIKPHNVMISSDGKVKVTDFGIAKATTSTTVSTSAMGSVHYTSPEQARGGYVDDKSDIYSIGITLYEMVTGKVPFDGESAVEVAMKHLQEEIIPPSKKVPGVPHSLEQIILKCTMKNSERRYRDVAELIKDLKRALVDPDGDFVQMIPLNNASTVIITEEELNDIRSFREYDEDEDDEDEDDEDYRRKRNDDSDDVNPRMNKVMKLLTTVVAILVLIVAVVVAGQATGILRMGQGITSIDSSGKIPVPALSGRKEGEVRRILEEAGLECKVVERRTSSTYEEGYVIEHSPEEGTKVKKGTTVEIVVSTGKTVKKIAVPDVSGNDEEEAQRILEDKGFTKISSVAVYSDEPQGTVISTDPEAGRTVLSDTRIVMQVSKGTEKCKVPNVIGKTESEARAAITQEGLTISTVETEYSESYEYGTVMKQTPSSGKVAKGTSVSLVVSLGKKPEAKSIVPGVLGTGENSAKQMIINAGLSVGDVSYIASDSVPAGCVISCDPGVGTELSKDSVVSLVISTGPAQSEIPEGEE